jgi:hypothetical protein
MRGGVEKAVLRDAARDILPDDLRLRRKSGFMLTSEAVDFFGADRKHSAALRHHLSKEAFARAAVFSYPAFRLVSLLAHAPAWKHVPALRRLRRTSNKVMMYMMQTHMLHDMFIARPRWNSARPSTPDLGHCRHGFAPVA